MTQAVALAIVVAVAFLISWLWRPRQAMEPGDRLLLVAYALLGGWALWFDLYSAPGQEPAAFRFWKPTVMYWVLSVVMLAAPALGWGCPAKAIVGTYFAFSNREWRWINRALAALCAVLGGFNLLMAFTASEGDWQGFKFSCMVNLLAILLLRVIFLWLDTMVRMIKYVHGRAKAFLA